MKLPQIPVHDLEGVTLNFEVLQLRDILDQTGESVLRLAVAGTVQVAFGTATLTYAGASPLSNEPTVTTGIPRLTKFAIAQFSSGFADSLVGTVICRGYASGSFTVVARHTANVSAQTQPVAWIAIG